MSTQSKMAMQSKTAVENSNQKSEGGISRRRFLQILGASSAAGVAGCTDSNKQQIFPLVSGDNNTVPGVAVWYSSTCTQCSAGCGIQVRTREGRAVKIEGNPDNPINKGGLCALGQSALQDLYDPDRVRQPLKRTAAGFVPATWAEVVSAVKAGAGDNAKKAFITGELQGTNARLVEKFCSAVNARHVTFDPSSQSAMARATEIVFGVRGIPTYRFDKADAVVNFGADFLETWVSPCEYARGWAESRRSKHPLKYVHIEPRLSLTGASADLWLKSRPGSELAVAKAVLKSVAAGRRQPRIDARLAAVVREAVGSMTVAEASALSDIAVDKILLAANYLEDAEHPLVIGGGAAAENSDGLALLVVVNLINRVLGSEGSTVDTMALRPVQSDAAAVADLVEQMERGEIKALFIQGTNPRFSLDSSLNFDETSVGKVPLVVAFSTHLDETSELAHYVLPIHSGLEAWGDAEARKGVRTLAQPTMTPVFDTKQFGDLLIEIGGEKVAASGATFLSELKDDWRKLHQEAHAGGDFEHFWLKSVERGGYFDASLSAAGKSDQLDQVAAVIKAAKGERSDLVLYPFPSIKSFDGRAANRPWLQELPDPITSVVWDSWAEVHPDRAKKYDLKNGDLVTIRNDHGEINVPVYLTTHVHPSVVAVPIGQGHKSLGRYAKSVGGGNVLTLTSKMNKAQVAALGGVPRQTSDIALRRGWGSSNLVTTVNSTDQGKREIARTQYFSAQSQLQEGHGGGHGGGHADGHHEPKQMYEQRGHPLYRWGMAIDLTACTGCSACVVACYAENNIPTVGKEMAREGREMSWLRIERYEDGAQSEELQVNFVPMLCQHCNNAPCEPVCPVYATYHNEEGMNVMVYNRCVGTRYCSNNCPYKVRRFNWIEQDPPTPLGWQLNPDVTKRGVGVMEKCTFCVQRISEAKDIAKDLGRPVRDGEVKPACVQSCPTNALAFGDLNDPHSEVSRLSHSARAYKILDHHINTQPAISYLERQKHKV